MQRDLGLLILRVGFGLTMLLQHGWSKLSNFSYLSANFPDPIGLGSSISLTLAVFSEFFCSIALILGILTRWFSLPLIITMLVAALVVHSHDPFAKKEMAVVYGVVYLTLFFTGAGRFSLDGFLAKRKGK